MKDSMVQTEIMVFKMFGANAYDIEKIENLSFTPEQRNMIRTLLDKAYRKGLKKDGR